jgi:hypothetical protein
LARCKQAAMTKGEPIAELKVWRKARDLTLDQAAEMLSKRMGREGDPIAARPIGLGRMARRCLRRCSSPRCAP